MSVNFHWVLLFFVTKQVVWRIQLTNGRKWHPLATLKKSCITEKKSFFVPILSLQLAWNHCIRGKVVSLYRTSVLLMMFGGSTVWSAKLKLTMTQEEQKQQHSFLIPTYYRGCHSKVHKFKTQGSVFTKFQFLRSSGMCPISLSVW